MSTKEQRNQLEREIAEAHAALDAYGVARGAGGHSIRYRIGLLVEAEREGDRTATERAAKMMREVIATRQPGYIADDYVAEFKRRATFRTAYNTDSQGGKVAK